MLGVTEDFAVSLPLKHCIFNLLLSFLTNADAAAFGRRGCRRCLPGERGLGSLPVRVGAAAARLSALRGCQPRGARPARAAGSSRPSPIGTAEVVGAAASRGCYPRGAGAASRARPLRKAALFVLLPG